MIFIIENISLLQSSEISPGWPVLEVREGGRAGLAVSRLQETGWAAAELTGSGGQVS